MPPCLGYAWDVARGKEDVCEDVKLMCERELFDYLERQEDDSFPYYFDPDKAARTLEFYKQFPFVAGERAERDELFDPEPWQEFLLGNIEGWRVKGDAGVRRHFRVLMLIGRKNGKTFATALLAMRELLLGTAGGEIVTISTTREQSRLAFDTAKSMCFKMGPEHPLLKKVIVRAEGIRAERTDGVPRWWRPLSSKPSSAEGRSVSCLLIDEAALITDRRLPASLLESQRGRKSPLAVFTSTAQDVQDSHFMDQVAMLRAGLRGAAGAERMFGLLYSVDRVKVGETDDEVFARVVRDPKLWKHGNPNLGVSTYVEHMEQDIAEAKVTPSARPAFLMKSLNVFASASTQWVETHVWEEAKPAVKEGVCYLGVDIGLRGDLTGVCLLWDHGTGAYSVEVMCYAPKFAFESLTKETRQVFDNALAEGSLAELGDRVLDMEALIQIVLGLIEKHDVQVVGVDPWRAKALVDAVEEKGHKILEVRQGTSLTPAINELERLIYDGRLWHGDGSFLRWQALNVRKEVNEANKNVKLLKPSYERKIDGIMSIVDAIAIARQGANVMASFEYEDYGGEEEAPKDDYSHLADGGVPDYFGRDRMDF